MQTRTSISYRSRIYPVLKETETQAYTLSQAQNTRRHRHRRTEARMETRKNTDG